MEIVRDKIFFDDGEIVRINEGIIGLAIKNNDVVISGGYDSEILVTKYDEGDVSYNQSLEMCDYMIEEWKQAKEIILRKMEERYDA